MPRIFINIKFENSGFGSISFKHISLNLKNLIESTKLPSHLAIIMDGNGRWAKKKGFLRIKGHEKGSDSVREMIEVCVEQNIPYLTLYAFSTENWKRPKLEVQTLMHLLIKALKQEFNSMMEKNIRLHAVGNLDLLPKKVKRELEEVMEKSKNNSKLTVTLALSYGSREEITQMVRTISDKVKNNIISQKSIDENIINAHLYTQNLPDVDLLIRTSGEQRISNFLLWQIAYAEIYFTNVLWPDFRKNELYEALINYQSRERRFGKTSEQLSKS